MGETKPKLGVSFLHSQDISMNNLCHCFPQGLLGAILWKRDFWDRARGQWTRRTSPPVPTAHFADTLEGIMETHRRKSQVVLISHQSDKIRGERWIFFLSISVYLSFDPLCCGLSHLYLVRDQLLLNRKEDEFLLFWCWALSNRDSVSAFPYNHFYDICKKRFYKVFARISQVIKMASRNSCDGWKERCLRGAPPPTSLLTGWAYPGCMEHLPGACGGSFLTSLNHTVPPTASQGKALPSLPFPPRPLRLCPGKVNNVMEAGPFRPV